MLEFALSLFYLAVTAILLAAAVMGLWFLVLCGRADRASEDRVRPGRDPDAPEIGGGYRPRRPPGAPDIRPEDLKPPTARSAIEKPPS